MGVQGYVSDEPNGSYTLSDYMRLWECACEATACSIQRQPSSHAQGGGALQGFCFAAVQYMHVDYTVLALALCYMDRLTVAAANSGAHALGGMCGHDAFIACAVLATKFLYDEADKSVNGRWAQYTGIPVARVNGTEMQCLRLLDFNLNATIEVHDQASAAIDNDRSLLAWNMAMLLTLSQPPGALFQSPATPTVPTTWCPYSEQPSCHLQHTQAQQYLPTAPYAVTCTPTDSVCYAEHHDTDTGLHQLLSFEAHTAHTREAMGMLAGSSTATADMYAQQHQYQHQSQQQQQHQLYHDRSSTLYYLQPLSELLAPDTHPCCALDDNGCALNSYPTPPLSAATFAPSPLISTDASHQHLSSSDILSSTHSLPLAQAFTYPPLQAMYAPKNLELVPNMAYFDAAHAGGYSALGFVPHPLPTALAGQAHVLPTMDSALGGVSSLLLAAAVHKFSCSSEFFMN